MIENKGEQEGAKQEQSRVAQRLASEILAREAGHSTFC